VRGILIWEASLGGSQLGYILIGQPPLGGSRSRGIANAVSLSFFMPAYRRCSIGTENGVKIADPFL